MPENDFSEVWKPIEGYPGRYVSNRGRVRGMRGNILKGTCNDSGYPCVRLKLRGPLLRVHRLVFAAFVGPIPPGIEINHRNGIRNDARIENLELATRQENVTHAIEVLGNAYKPPVHIGEDAHFSKLTADKVTQIRQLHKKASYSSVAKEFGVSHATVYKIWNRESWKHII